MKFEAVETVFFYSAHGKLLQRIDVTLVLKESCENLYVTVDAGAKGNHCTEHGHLDAGVHTLICYAPVAYPNLVDGKHIPISAGITVTAGASEGKRTLTLGRHRPWTIYVCQDICSDFTWGMPDEQTKEESSRMLLACLDEMDRTDGWDVEDRNRYNLNQTMEVEWFLEQASEADKERFFRRVREGRLMLSATYNSNLTALMPTEQAIRSLYYGRELERRYGIGLDTVEHIEMPSMAWGMLQIYAGSGIRKFAKAWLDFNSHYLKKSPEVPLFHWQTPDGGTVLSLMPRGANLRAGYTQGGFLLGKNSREAADELHDWWIPYYESIDAYPFDCFALMGAYCDLNAASKYEPRLMTEAVRGYNDSPWAYPRLVNATLDQYFDAVRQSARDIGADIPVLSGDFGVSWEDWPIHYAHVAARMKRGITRAFALERLSAGLAAACGQSPVKSITDRAALLMQKLAEHPWNGTNDDERWHSYEKRSGWVRALEDCNDEMVRSISHGEDILLYNPLCRPRTGIAWLQGDVCIPGAQIMKEAGMTVVAVETGAMGLYPLAAAPVRETVAAGSGWMENEFIRVDVDTVTGAIVHFIDKGTGRDWAGKSGLNQLIYLSDGVPLRPSCTSVETIAAGPVAAGIRIGVAAPRCRVETTLWINAVNGRLFIDNKLNKEPSTEPLNVYFAFPFKAPRRQYHFESTGAILRPGLVGRGGDILPGAGQEVYAVHDFIDVNDRGGGVILSPLDNSIFQLGGNTYDLMPDGPPEGDATVLALCLTNHAYQEIRRDQYGHRDFRFRFELMAYEGDYDGGRAVQFGREANNPLMPISPIPALREIAGRPLVRSLTEGVFMTALKPAEEDGSAVVLRFWNAGDDEREAVFDVAALDMSHAGIIDLVERPAGRAVPFDGKKLRIAVKGRGMGAVLLSKKDKEIGL